MRTGGQRLVVIIRAARFPTPKPKAAFLRERTHGSVRMRRRRRCRCFSSRARVALRSWSRGRVRCTQRFAEWHPLFCLHKLLARARPIWMPVDARTSRSVALHLAGAGETTWICQGHFSGQTIGKASRTFLISLKKKNTFPDATNATHPLGKGQRRVVDLGRGCSVLRLCSGVWNLPLPVPHACTINMGSLRKGARSGSCGLHST